LKIAGVLVVSVGFLYMIAVTTFNAVKEHSWTNLPRILAFARSILNKTNDASNGSASVTMPEGGWMVSWENMGNTIRVVARVAPFLPYRSHVHLILVRRIQDNTVDEMEDTHIRKSPPFSMNEERLILEIPMSEDLLAQAFPDKNLRVSLVLLPNPLTPDEITKLSDVERLGGKILATNGIGLHVSRRVEPGLVPPSPGDPSFPFVSPGILVNNDTWAFFVRDGGTDPIYNVEILIIDKETQSAAAIDKSIVPDRIYKRVSYPEIDPIASTIGPEMIKMTPLTMEHGHYSITMATRDGVFRESMAIRYTDRKVSYALFITKDKPKRTFLKCRDAGYPKSEEWTEKTLPSCFPKFY
jgi:hypothetical protein